MRFIKSVIIFNKTVTCFCARLVILSARTNPPILSASRAVLVTIENVFTRQAPKVKQRIFTPAESENRCIIGLTLSALVLRSLCDTVAYALLVVKPLVKIGGVQIGDIKLRERNGTLEVKCGIVRGHTLDGFESFDKLRRCTSPVGEDDFALFQHGEVERTLGGVVGGIENRGDGENLGNEKVLARIDAPLSVDNLPPNVVNQGLGHADCLASFALVLGDKGERSSFCV